MRDQMSKKKQITNAARLKIGQRTAKELGLTGATSKKVLDDDYTKKRNKKILKSSTRKQ